VQATEGHSLFLYARVLEENLDGLDVTSRVLVGLSIVVVVYEHFMKRCFHSFVYDILADWWEVQSGLSIHWKRLVYLNHSLGHDQKAFSFKLFQHF
jgi:hypothetical protein